MKLSEMQGKAETLRLEHVSKFYGQQCAVNDLSFTVKGGRILAILGSNGSGKTTTFRMLLGLINKNKGKIFYGDQELDHQNKRLFGYLPEERSMLRDLKVKEQITYLARLKQMDRLQIEMRLADWLEELKVEQYQNRRIMELSKGNQQKIQVICSLIHDPQILIFDEPLNGLDLDNVLLFKSLCMKLKKQGKTILISSHQYNNIEDLCDDVVYLYQGDCLFKGSLRLLKQRCPYRLFALYQQYASLFDDEPGILSVNDEGNWKVAKVESQQVADRLVRQCLKRGIDDFRCETVSLQDLIKEALSERTG